MCRRLRPQSVTCDHRICPCVLVVPNMCIAVPLVGLILCFGPVTNAPFGRVTVPFPAHIRQREILKRSDRKGSSSEQWLPPRSRVGIGCSPWRLRPTIRSVIGMAVPDQVDLQTIAGSRDRDV
jgi:hypothetical protein